MRYPIGFLIVADLILAGWFLSTILPVRRQSVDIPLQFEQGAQHFSRKTSIDTPAFLRQGEKGRFIVRLLADPAEPGGSAVSLEARFEIANIPARDRTVYTTMVAGKTAAISWDIQTSFVGVYQGKIWLWAGDEDTRQLILAAPVEIRCQPVWPARAIGGGGFILFGVLGVAAWRGERHRRGMR